MRGVMSKKKTECTSTFARYAVGGSAVEDHPAEERAVGHVLLGPGRSQPPAPAALLAAHARHVQHLAPPVLTLLQPAIPRWKKQNKQTNNKSLKTQRP